MDVRITCWCDAGTGPSSGIFFHGFADVIVLWTIGHLYCTKKDGVVSDRDSYPRIMCGFCT